MIASNVVGHVTAFFLIANGDTEIDVELTGFNSRVGWMNIWHDHKQNPVTVALPFDASEGWHTYSFEWRQDYIAWSIDGKLVLNRSDIATTPPNQANYKLAINSWTQVQKEENINWAGQFKYPTDGTIPQAQFRNMKFRPATATQSAKEMQQLGEGDSDLGGGGGKGKGSGGNGSKTQIAFEDDGEEVNDGSAGDPGRKQVKSPTVEKPAQEPTQKPAQKPAQKPTQEPAQKPAEEPAMKKKSSAKKTVEGNGALASLVFLFAVAVVFLSLE